MNQLQTKGIVLAHTDFGEADRIITVITPDQGKLRLMAKGVRKSKSKLAGSIELFSTSDLTYIRGRGEIGTLVSARLDRHYGNIVKDIDRVQLGYELIKQLNKATEDNPEEFYFDLLEKAFSALDDADIDLGLIKAWFGAQLIQQAGHGPNLQTDAAGNKLNAAHSYNFDLDTMSFAPHASGRYRADHIKTMRLIFGYHSPQNISSVQGMHDYIKPIDVLITTISQQVS